MHKWRLLIVVTAAVVFEGVAVGQSKPNFSGTWVLVEMVDRGSGRGGGSPAKVSDIGGTPVNCAAECTIVQTETSLTVSRPPNEKGIVYPDMVVNLDGRQTPGRAISIQWEDSRLIIARALTGALTITQTLSLA